jgi:uncharacterized protein (DUF433 family)
MALHADRSILETGIYTVPEAQRLTGVRAARIRRWLRGYHFRIGDADRFSPRVWEPQHAPIDGALALGFRDLLEIRVVDAFLTRGVSWKTLRIAAERARAAFGVSHPFSMEAFKTDGRLIFAELVDEHGESAIIEITQQQRYFARIISPYLQGIEFAEEEPVRWWPLGTHRRVVIDPIRSFGQPIVAKRGIPTSVLAAAVRANDSIEQVARWYNVSSHEVRDALAFEKKLAA